MNNFNWKWTLKDATFTKDKGTVFSCFACGGGSTMGYKLAGFDVIGCNEIDPRMMDVYVKNNNPKYAYCEPIQDFKKRTDLPSELYNLDILDGSPPCSTFSIVGSRQKSWGVEKKFREGQTKQVLDTLFFDFIDLAKKLQPKIVISENVKGLLLGDAIAYVLKIYEEFDKAEYYCQHWILNASVMGVPQQRERIFFVCLRKDLAKPFLYQANLFEEKPKLDLTFDEKKIVFGEVADYSGKEMKSEISLKIWNNRRYGDSGFNQYMKRKFEKESRFGTKYLYTNKVCPTLTTKRDALVHFDQPKYLGASEVCCISSFPQDYNFAGQSPHYVCGMSVPPLMIAKIVGKISEQWLNIIKTLK